MRAENKTLWGGILLAAVLWFWMFSPWTKDIVGNFWLCMGVAGAILAAWALVFRRDFTADIKFSLGEVLLGGGLAAAFWGVFWVGDKLSQLMFSFARGQVDMIYTMKDGSNPVAVALLLLFLVGPAEELFWRGFVENKLIGKMGQWKGFIVATLIYALVHIWSGNFMLVMAALVIGALWGFIYMKWPRHLGAIIISHALWDVAAFVLFPF